MPGLVVIGLANWLTLFRLLAAPVLVAAFVIPGPLGEGLRLGIFLVASATDWLDGYVARTRGQITAFGREMDPAADKMLVLGALLMLAGTGALSLPSLIAAATLLLRDLLVAGLRAALAGTGQALQTSRSAKAKTAIQMAALTLLLSGSLGAGLHAGLPQIGEWLLWVAAVLALGSAAGYASTAWRQLRNTGENR